jgi:uncharacterized protein involved in exopolysaccharide biosynthesis
MWLPAVYVSEGKLLIESQRIPTELVRPTVTTGAAERIEIMRQRLLTRDNVGAIIDKFKLFPDRRSVQSPTELIDLVRERTRIMPTELGTRRGANDRATLTVAVGFEYEQPDLAMRVASEFITVLLNEDLKNRTSRAGETTKFLEREVKRLQTELTSVEGQISDLRRTRTATASTNAQAAIQAAIDRHQVFVEETSAEIANLKAERLAKANRLAWNHPDVQALQRKISSLEQAIANRPALPQASEREVELGLEPLLVQQTAIQERLNAAADKLAAAQMGEALERDQYAERLEVIEQPSRPVEPIRPKRAKLLVMVLGLALAAGGGLAVGTEFLDRTIRTRGDLTRLVDSSLVVAIPVVESRRDRMRRKLRLWRTLGLIIVALSAAATAAYFYLPPLDLLWQDLLIKVPRYLNR